MKKNALLIIFFFIFCYAILPQTIIKNPDKPLSTNVGRVIQLKEVMRIKEDGKEIIFQGPYDLQIGDDDSIYFYDNFRLYGFDDEGRFIFKLIKQGEGPGEANLRTSCLVTENEIIVQAWQPPKIMRFDFLGKLKSETKTQLTHPLQFLGLINEKIYSFYDEMLPFEERIKEGYMDFFTSLYEFSPDLQKRNKIYSFPVKHYVRPGAWWSRANFNYVLKDHQTLFVSHTADYQIEKFNIKKNKIEKIFKRKYRRIKIPPKKRRRKTPGSPPPLNYYHDILKLLIFGDQLWVTTSTRDKQENRLIDVYNMEGAYINNFYLQFPKGITCYFYYGRISIKGSYIYTIDEDKDGYFSIAKYKIMDNK
jgi:hypothetical protein